MEKKMIVLMDPTNGTAMIQVNIYSPWRSQKFLIGGAQNGKKIVTLYL